jgi:hypothetical protein
MLEPVNADVAFIAARPALDSPEVREYGGAGMSGIAFLPAVPTGHERIASGSIDEEPGLPLRLRTQLIDGRYAVPATFQAFDPYDFRAFPRIDAGSATPFEQDLIELGTTNLKGMIRAVSERLAKIESLMLFAGVPDGKVSAELGNADSLHLIQGTESFQER